MSSGTAARFVVADDDRSMRESICAALQTEWPDAEITAAADGREAIQAIERATGPVNALILDIFMPRQDGMETLMMLRKNFPAIPAIVVTGGSQTTLRAAPMRQAALLLGASCVLEKPFSATQLSDAVRGATKPACA